MNKFGIIGIVLVVILAGGFIYSKSTDTDNCSAENGKDVVLTVHSKKLQWKFEPESITVEKCDRVDLTVINEDNFDHGVAIDAFGISQRLPANGTININFVASKEGEFPFYCSVSCSTSENPSFNLKDGKIETGTYAGTVRGHFEHIGKFIVILVTSVTN